MKKKLKRKLRVAKYIIYKETLVDFKEHFWTFIGSFAGIGLIGLFNTNYFTVADNLFLIGSFGASSVLIYGIINSPLAQPRNLIGGHVISAFIGITLHRLTPHEVWLSSALSVSLSIVFMQVTKTLHPPGGATALIANIGSEKIKHLGYYFILVPVLSGVILLLMIAILVNNIGQDRCYPSNRQWYKVWKRKYR